MRNICIEVRSSMKNKNEKTNITLLSWNHVRERRTKIREYISLKKTEAPDVHVDISTKMQNVYTKFTVFSASGFERVESLFMK